MLIKTVRNAIKETEMKTKKMNGMKKEMLKFLSVSAVWMSTLMFSQVSFADKGEGSGHSGGGNITEADLRSYMGKIDAYLLSEAGRAVFPEIVAYDANHPAETFHQLIQNTNPVVDKGELKDSNGVVRDCMSYANPGNRYFVCNSDALPNKTLENQPSFYRIVLHELLVQAGIEKPLNKDVPSVYAVSSRITENVHLETYQEWVPGRASNQTEMLSDSGIICSDYSPEKGKKELLYFVMLPNGDYTLMKQKVPHGQARYGLVQEQIISKADERGYRLRAFIADLFSGDVTQKVMIRGNSMSLFKPHPEYGRSLSFEGMNQNMYLSTTTELEKTKRYTSGQVTEFVLHLQLVNKQSSLRVYNRNMVCRGFPDEGRFERLPSRDVFLDKTINSFKKNYIRSNLRSMFQ